MLSACASSTKNLVQTSAVDLKCSVLCETQCKDVEELRVDKDNKASIDDVLEYLVLADFALDECEIARASCVECIDRGRKIGVIR